jgi:hypothetical protein
VEGFRGYADHMASAEFRAGLEELQELARKTNDRLDVRGRTVVALPPPPGVRRPHSARVDGHTHRSRRTRHGPRADTVRDADADAGRLTYPPAQTS